MIRLKRVCSLLLAGVLLIALCGVATAEEKPEEKNQIGYYIKSIFPTNQLAGNISYFSLLTRPASTQTLQVLVFNENSEEIQVTVEVNNAYTNRNGIIEYSGGEGAASNESGLAGMITVEQPLLRVPANGSATARLRLTMPKEPFEGELLAGIMITRVPDEEKEATVTGGMRIINVFAYNVAVRVTQSTAQPPAPDFALTGARMDTIGGFPAVVLDVVNLKPQIYTDVKMKANIYPQEGGDPVLSYEMTLSMSPSVSAPLSHMLMNEDKLSPGAYRVEATLDYEGQTWRFETPLVVE